MRKLLIALTVLLGLSFLSAPVHAKDGADFGDVVKLIERHYGARHRGIPLLARAGIGVARKLTRFGEYGSFKLAVFEDQDFSANPRGELQTRLRASMEPFWSPLVQMRAERDSEQTYVYTRSAGKFFKILVVSIQPRDATVVQADISPQKLMLLMKDPDSAAKAVTDEAMDEQ
ncbi:MAG TPA: hypothetical protein VEQ42_13565 [Pyrinomonadaceae bacterium]|nr:hypothetical protein [Pyrinomonadaceae bacterium]